MRAPRLVALALLAACSYDRPPDIGPDGVIIEEIDAAIVVSGLWDGAAPIAVSLRGGREPIETSLPGNGTAPIRALSGVELAVEVEAPPMHTCTAASPVVLVQDAVIEVTCVGPATVTLKTPYDIPLPFDRDELEVSSLVGEADLVIAGTGLTLIEIDGTAQTIAAETRVPILDLARTGRELAVRLEADTLSLATTVTIRPVLPVTEVARIAVGGMGERGGEVVAVDKDVIVVGGDIHAAGDRSKLAVLVYRLQGSTWTFEAELPGPVGGGAYGRAIAVSDDTIIVGAPLASNAIGAEAGEVWFWQRQAGIWTRTRTEVGARGGALFGLTVAIDGTRAAAGAPLAAPNQSGYVKTYTFTSAWSETSTIDETDLLLGLAADDRFGSSLAIRGIEMLVGVEGDDRTGTGWQPGTPDITRPRVSGANYGSVLHFQNNSPISWLQATSSSRSSSMGEVGFAGDDWLVGVPFWDDLAVSDAGLAYVGPMAGSLLPAEPVAPLAQHGRIVAGTSTAFIIGARDRVRVYARDGGDSYPLLTTLEDPAQPSFAAGMAMASGTIVVGVPGAQTSDTGSIVIYR